MGFWRDSSGRLTFDLPGVAAADFRRGEQAVGLDWDVWMEFTAVAKSEASEQLVRDIAAWLGSSRPAKAEHSKEKKASRRK